MVLKSKTIGAAAFVALLSIHCATAQVSPGTPLGALGQPGPQGGRGNLGRVVSPEIHADRSVTLRLSAPNANDVRIAGHIIGPNAHWLSKDKTLPLKKDDRGVWSITLGPLQPDIYEYGFVVDGVPIYNAGNPSLVEITGPQPAFYDAAPVPHGDVRMVVYESRATNSTRYMLVYTPPGYDNSRNRYPVLYLMHGGNCCENQWVQLARANTILDNLLAAGKAKPMIVVMPLGARSGPSEGLTPFPSQMENSPPPAGGNTGPQSNYAPGNLFEIDLLTGIIPFIDHRYRTIADADHRAMSGLSQRGIQTLTIGLRHTETFHWLAPMSAGAENMGDDQFVSIMGDVYNHPEPLKKI